MTTPEMEISLANYFNPRQNLIIPNVSWGMFNHECDLIVVGKSGLIREIEIKISKADLIRDTKKSHNHFDRRISRLYFAVPGKMRDCVEHVPDRAGIIVVNGFYVGAVQILRAAQRQGNYHITQDERMKLLELANMRIWGLKSTIERYKEKGKKKGVNP